MKSIQDIIKTGKQTLKIEVQALQDLEDSIDSKFAEVVNLILHSKGRVVLSGIGKSANIANKIVATLNSTGTPAIFMHAADAIHGDLGNVQDHDVVICLSKSGNTPEIKVLVPYLKEMGNKLVALTANKDSFLAQQADHLLYTPIAKEACPNNLAPTSSTTAQLAMGDALAVCLLEMRDFTSEDFAKYHPGGALGKKLYLRVSDLYPHNEKPAVELNTPFQDVIIEISSKRLGATVVTENGKVMGIITDGDVRRLMSKSQNLSEITASDMMSKSPRTIAPEMLASEAMALMKSNNITQLIVEEKSNYVGMIHLHDILKEGIL